MDFGAEGVARHPGLSSLVLFSSGSVGVRAWLSPLAAARQNTSYSVVLCYLESDDGALGCSSDCCRRGEHGAERGRDHRAAVVVNSKPEAVRR
jgi:hypothetical protein